MVGVEIIDPAAPRDAQGNPTAHPELARAIPAQVSAAGPHSRAWWPSWGCCALSTPLTITEQETDRVTAIFAEAVSAVLKLSGQDSTRSEAAAINGLHAAQS